MTRQNGTVTVPVPPGPVSVTGGVTSVADVTVADGNGVPTRPAQFSAACAECASAPPAAAQARRDAMATRVRERNFICPPDFNDRSVDRLGSWRKADAASRACHAIQDDIKSGNLSRKRFQDRDIRATGSLAHRGNPARHRDKQEPQRGSKLLARR